MSRKHVLGNAMAGIGGQISIFILGLIAPRIMINSYGSDTNGLLNTISQVYTYMALLEAGIGQATQNALYRPFSQKNESEISRIVCLSNVYFRRITKIYALGICILSAVLPFVLQSSVDKLTISFIVFLEGMSGVLTFSFIQTKRIVINVDGTNYINAIVDTIAKVFSIIVKIGLAYICVNISIMQSCYFLLAVLKVCFYQTYYKKKYPWIVKNIEVGNEVLPDRKYYIFNEVAWIVFSSTDMIVLSVFLNTSMASVYSIYSMIFLSLNQLLNSVYNSLTYLLGNSFHVDIPTYEKKHDLFMFVFVGLITIMMCVAYYLAIPFISLYTRGIEG